MRTLVNQCSTSKTLTLKASPKAISGEPAISGSIGISPLPTPHPRTFQRAWVRASIQCYLNFTTDMGRSLVSGLRPRTKRPIQTRFRCGSRLFSLTSHGMRNSPVHSTKARHHPLTGSDYCRHTVSGSLSSFEVLFCFPHGTGSLSIAQGYLALGDGPPRFRRNFTCSAVLRIHSRERSFDYGVVTLYDGPFGSLRLPRSFVTPYRMSYNPRGKPLGLNMFRFARRYSGNRICFLFLQYLDVSVPGLSSLPYVFR